VEDASKLSKLKRPIHQMPDDIEILLKQSSLMERYKLRPPYQQNDYIGWINRAKRPETREKRIKQMIQELQSGEFYMGMKYYAK